MARWLDICSVDDLQPDSGVCALVEGRQVAIFLLLEPGDGGCEFIRAMPIARMNSRPPQAVYAISNYDPFGKANVLSRGLVGDINGQPVVASPLYKQHFNLQTGVCLEDDAVKIPIYAIRIENSRVQVDISSLSHETQHQHDGAAL